MFELSLGFGLHSFRYLVSTITQRTIMTTILDEMISTGDFYRSTLSVIEREEQIINSEFNNVKYNLGPQQVLR